MYMRALLFLLFFLSLAPLLYAEEENAGIVQGIWYADDEVFADRPTRVYVAVRNNTGSDLTGTIDFYDGDTRLGRKSIQALNGHIVESWSDWTASYGNHTLKATLSRIELHKVGETEEEVEVTSAIAEDSIFVDYDTDQDGVGNEQDRDDDNDGKSDEEEKRNGTDPLKTEINQTTETNTASNENDSNRSSDDGDDSDAQEEGNENTHQGVERFLGDGRAQETVSKLTSVINDAKVKVDAYRAERKEKLDTKKAAENYEDGFGTVATSTTENGAAIDEWSLSDFFSVVFDLFKTIFSWVYTVLLAVLSFVLGYPILVQVGALLLILILLFKTAAKFGRRNRKI
jgi:hypothetical protein